jgi:hypothetical protein
MRICAGTQVGQAESIDLSLALQKISQELGIQDESEFFSVAWNTGSYNSQTQELSEPCTELIQNDENFRKQFNEKWSSAINEAKGLSESENQKFQPQLEGWDDRLYKLGGGGLLDYLSASSATYNLIRQGAAYSLTGASRGDVQSVDCTPTNRSRWSRGIPSGWWTCSIDFVGSDFEFYSIEFNANSWSGFPDGGRQAGSDLKDIEIPQDLKDWLVRKNESD